MTPSKLRVGLVWAHPDDETLVGSMLGRLREAEIPVTAIYMTRGEGTTDDLRDEAARAACTDMARVRDAELQAALAWYGVAAYEQLGQPDRQARLDPPPDGQRVSTGIAPPLPGTRDAATASPAPDARPAEPPAPDACAAFLRSATWNVPLIEHALRGWSQLNAITVIVTLLADHEKTHIHHRATARIVRDLVTRGAVTVQGLYGAYETSWYPPNTFPSRDDELRFDSGAHSPRLGMRYCEYSARGARFHQSQRPAHRGIVEIDDVVVPLVRTRCRDFEQILKAAAP